MSPPKRYAKKHAKASQRRRLKAQERLERQQQQAQRSIEALHQALEDLELPDTLVAEIEWRLRAQHQLLGKLFGLMFPTLFGCRNAHELTRVRGWDKNIPGRMLRALPKRSWLKRLRRLGREVLISIWRYLVDKSPATLSRWQWRWMFDDTVFKKYGDQLALVGRWWSGQHKRVVLGIDGLLLLVVIGDGKLIVPVDFVVRRPDPTGPGAPCRDKLTWAQVMLDECLAAFTRRGIDLPAPMVVADSWFGDSTLMQHVATWHQGTWLVQGKTSYVFTLQDGRRVKGHELIHDIHWPWRHSLQAPGCRYARLRAVSPTYGKVTVIVVDEPGEDRFYLLCLSTSISAPRLLKAWTQRHWIEQMFRTLKHLLATEACQAHSEDAYYGHLVLRLMAGFVLFYTSRVIFKGRVSMEEMVFSLKHYWAIVDFEPLELYGISPNSEQKAA